MLHECCTLYGFPRNHEKFAVAGFRSSSITHLFKRNPSGRRWYKKNVLIHTDSFPLSNFRSRELSFEIFSVPLRDTSSIKLNFALAIFVNSSVMGDEGYCSPSWLRHKFAMFSRISSQFVRIVRESAPSRSFRSVPLPFLHFAFFFSRRRIRGEGSRSHPNRVGRCSPEYTMRFIRNAAYKTQKTAYDW